MKTCDRDGCTNTFEDKRIGPEKKFCTPTCQREAWIERRRVEAVERYGRTTKVMRAVVPWEVHKAFTIEADERRVEVDDLVAEAMREWLRHALADRTLQAEAKIIDILAARGALHHAREVAAMIDH